MPKRLVQTFFSLVRTHQTALCEKILVSPFLSLTLLGLFYPDTCYRLAAGHKEWADYSLESTARLLAGKFVGHAVWVVLPTRHVNGAYASYDNFASTDWASDGAVPECETSGVQYGYSTVFV